MSLRKLDAKNRSILDDYEPMHNNITEEMISRENQLKFITMRNNDQSTMKSKFLISNIFIIDMVMTSDKV